MHFFKTELFVREDDFKYVILLPLYPQHWDYRWTPHCPVYRMLDGTQASVHATQAFYQLNFIPSLENAGVCTYLEHFNSTCKWE